jgi:hypothetical protein
VGVLCFYFSISGVNIKGGGRLWFLIWFQVINNNIEHYQLNQFPTQSECEEALEDAKVLITTSQTTVYCFEVIPK